MLTKKQELAVLAYDAENRKTPGLTIRYTLLNPLPKGELETITVAVRRDKAGKPSIKDVARATTMKPGFMMRDMDCYGMSGWVVGWDKDHEKEKERWCWSKRGYTIYDCGWYDYDLGFGRGFPSIWDAVVNPEAIDKTKYKYGAFAQNPHLSLMDYCRMLKEHPRMELVGKAGLWNLVKPSIAKRLAADKNFVRFLAQNAEQLKERRYTATDVTHAYVHGTTLDGAMEYRRAKSLMKYQSYPAVLRPHASEIVAHIAKTEIPADEWARYVTYAEKVGWNVNDKHVYLPPKNGFARRLEQLEEQAYRATVESGKHDKTETNALMRKAKMRFGKLEGLSAFGLSVHIPASESELKAEGDYMHNCIGSMGYGRRIAEEASLVLFLKKDGKPFADAEIAFEDGKATLRQCYLRFNKKSTKEAEQLAEKALESVRRSLRTEKTGAKRRKAA